MSTILTNVKSSPVTDLAERTKRRLHRLMHKIRKAQAEEALSPHIAKRASDYGPFSVRCGPQSETDALIAWMSLKLGTK